MLGKVSLKHGTVTKVDILEPWNTDTKVHKLVSLKLMCLIQKAASRRLMCSLHRAVTVAEVVFLSLNKATKADGRALSV